MNQATGSILSSNYFRRNGRCNRLKISYSIWGSWTKWTDLILEQRDLIHRSLTTKRIQLWKTGIIPTFQNSGMMWRRLKIQWSISSTLWLKIRVSEEAHSKMLPVAINFLSWAKKPYRRCSILTILKWTKFLLRESTQSSIQPIKTTPRLSKTCIRSWNRWRKTKRYRSCLKRKSWMKRSQNTQSDSMRKSESQGRARINRMIIRTQIA